MIFSGSAVVDRTTRAGSASRRRRPVVPGRHLHRAQPRTGRPRTSPTATIAGGPGRSTRATRSSISASKDFRDPKVFWHEPTAPLGHGHRARPISTRCGSSARRDLKRWETLSDFGPAGATGGVWECPDLFPLPVDGEPATRAGCSTWTSTRARSPADLAGSTSSARSTDGRSSTTTRRIGRCGSTTARTSTRRSRSPTCRRPTAGASGWPGSATGSTPTTSRRESWRGAQSVPRELHARRLPEGIRLVQAPVAELTALRDTRSP